MLSTEEQAFRNSLSTTPGDDIARNYVSYACIQGSKLLDPFVMVPWMEKLTDCFVLFCEAQTKKERRARTQIVEKPS